MSYVTEVVLPAAHAELIRLGAALHVINLVGENLSPPVHVEGLEVLPEPPAAEGAPT